MKVKDIKNIYCVGWNYVLYVKELYNDILILFFLFFKFIYVFVEVVG